MTLIARTPFVRSVVRPLRLATLILLAGCGYEITRDSDGPDSPTSSVSIVVLGQCRAVARRIECRDESESNPPRQLQLVQWELSNSATGLSLDSRRADPGDEVSFPGLASDVYEVRQRVFARDGGTAQKVYSDLFVR